MERENIGPNLKKALTTPSACLKLIWIWLSWALILEKAKTKPYLPVTLLELPTKTKSFPYQEWDQDLQNKI